MPHLLIERKRTFAKVFSCTYRKREDFPAVAYLIEVLDIIAGLIFVWGSACFIPHYSKELSTFLLGCGLYIIGGFLYVIICSVTLLEAIIENGWFTFESFENCMYMLGSWIFLAGTVLYWPEEAQYEHIEALQECSLGQYFNLFSPEFEGTLLFIAGSVLFCFAAFANALNQRRFDQAVAKLLTAITSLYMAGSLLFVMGSVAFLPNLGCNEQMLTIGAWCFIVGSVFFVIGAILSFWRTTIVLSATENEGLVATKGEECSR